MTQESNGHTAPLAAAPTDVPPIVKPAPQNYSVEFLFRTEEGFDVLMRGNDLTPKDAMLWAKAASKQLADQGFKPVRRDVIVTTTTAAAAAPGAAAAAGASSSEAEWIKGEGGRPPRCSIHGAGVWREGVSGPKAKNPGTAFAFWSCSTRDCRPKGAAV